MTGVADTRLQRKTLDGLAAHRQRWLGANIPYGECLCGCGARTSTATVTRSCRDWIAGEPTKYLIGHARARPQRFELEDRGHSSSCWIWQGARADTGYGTMPGPRGVTAVAHRVFYERHVGPIPDGLQLDHLCRQRLCVNPAHLEPVTSVENLRRGNVVKLTPRDVRAIRASNETTVALAARYHVNSGHVSRIKRGLAWATA